MPVNENTQPVSKKTTPTRILLRNAVLMVLGIAIAYLLTTFLR